MIANFKFLVTLAYTCSGTGLFTDEWYAKLLLQISDLAKRVTQSLASVSGIIYSIRR